MNHIARFDSVVQPPVHGAAYEAAMRQLRKQFGRQPLGNNQAALIRARKIARLLALLDPDLIRRLARDLDAANRLRPLAANVHTQT